jgi:trans-aconitate methyltransferase
VTGRHNPWLAIPLGDYERHMEEVGQVAALSELFGDVLAMCRPRSVAILGVGGGNGLERIDPAITTRVVGLDISSAYLEEARSRYPFLETHCVDLAHEKVRLPPVELVHAALIFEHAGLGPCLENALSLVAPEGRFSAVLQLPGEPIESACESVRILDEHFTWIEPAVFRCGLERRGMSLVHEAHKPLPHGKAFWMGVFAGH